MNKLTLKHIFLLVVLILSLILIIASLFLSQKQKKEDELTYQRLLQEQLDFKKAEQEKEQKIYLMGKFDPNEREDFILVPDRYTIGENKMYLRKETLDAFLKMQNAADIDEVDLKIASATRNFDYQKGLWEKKWTGVTLIDGQNLSKSILDGLERFKKILEYSAVPGTSRHHWGTDIDINAATLEYFKTKKGEEIYEWLIQNAPLFGFCQPYNLKGSARPTGYNEEKWHWSYLPLAKTFTEEYKNLIKEEDINGFDGDQYVLGQNLINNYVLSINPDCF